MRARLLILLGVVFLIRCQCQHAVCFESPAIVTRLEIRDQNNAVLWRLDGDGQHRLSDLDWGVVPDGYNQLSPSSGAPRALNKGEPVLLIWRGTEKFTRHWGVASSASVIRYGIWAGGSAAGLQDSQIFLDEPKTIDPAKGYPTY